MLVMGRTAFTPVAIPVIQVMGGYYQYNGRYEEVVFYTVEKLLCKKKYKANAEQDYR